MEENESIYKTFKYRIYPTPTQIEMFRHWFNADKWIWNYLIRKVFSEEFEEKNASRFKLRDDILDNGPSFLNRKTRKEVSDLLIDAAVHKFIMNYNLYKTMIRKDRTSIYSNSNTKYKPKLKYGSHTSCVLSKKNENTIQIRDGMLNMTTSKFYGRQTFKTKEEIKLDINTIKQVQFLKKDKKYFMCIVCKIEKKVKKTESKIGIDMGVKNFIISFNGKEYTEYNIPKKIFELCEKIDKLNKLYSNSKKDSKRGLKLKSKLNKLYKKQTNIKKDFIEKIIHELVNKYSEIIIEPFSWNKKRYNTFNRNVHLMSPSLFILRLEQKCLEYGVKLVIVKQGTPTTQTCSNCGHVKIDDDKLILKDRIYCCKKCGHKQDRDENAAKNIYNYVV